MRARPGCPCFGWVFHSLPGCRPRTAWCRRIPGRSRQSSGSAPTPDGRCSTRSSSAFRLRSWRARSSGAMPDGSSRRVRGRSLDQFTGPRAALRPPSLAITVLTILMPVLLMLLAALVQADDARWSGAAMDRICRQPADGDAAGDACWRSTPSAGRAGSIASACSSSRRNHCRRSPSVLLVVGAGGGFGRVLVTAGVDQAIATVVGGLQLVAAGARLGHRRAAARSPSAPRPSASSRRPASWRR